MFLQERKVLEIELLLKILCAGGNDHPLAGKDRRNKIGEGLAGSRSGLDDQVPPVRERLLDCLGHFELAGAEFVVGVPFREETLPAEELTRSQRA